jgi:WD40 repeat protein
VSPDEATPLEDELASLLAVCDEVLAAGLSAASLDPSGAASDVRARLERDLSCLRLLRQHWPESTTLTNPAPDAAPPLTRLGRFEILRELGRGGFGVVFLAHDPELRREVALKVPRADALVTAELRARFRLEAQAAAGLEHPNIVAVYEAGEVGAVCYIAAAYCPGITLAQWLRQRSEPPPCCDAAALVAALADALQHAHSRGVLHRDLKPANVLLQSAKPQAADVAPLTTHQPKITDFGLARILAEGEEHTRSGVIVGTPGYMAPEQAAGKNRAVSTAADVYALGVILYELLTGRVPFQGATALEVLRQVEAAEPPRPRSLRPAVPRDLETVCLKCLQKEPERRYASAAALADDLRRFLAGEPVQARPVGRLHRTWRWCRRNPALATITGLAVIALVAVAVVSVLFGWNEARNAAELERSLRESRAHLRTAEYRLADNYRERGLALCEQGEVGPGVLWMARGLEVAPADADDLHRNLRHNLAGWGRLLTPLRASLAHPPDAVRAVAFSPDGKTLLTGSAITGQARGEITGAARLWDADTGRPLGPPLALPREARVVAFSPDGKTFLTACGDRGLVKGERLDEARLWDAATSRPVGPPLRPGGLIVAAAFGPDGKSIWTVTYQRTVQSWDPGTGQPLGAPLRLVNVIPAAAFSADGRTLVTVEQTPQLQSRVTVWATATGKPVAPSLPFPGVIRTVTLSPDGRTLLTGSDRVFRFWDAATGKPLGPNLDQPALVGAAAFSPDGRTLATGLATEPGVQLWDAATRLPLGPPLPHRGPALAVAFSPDSRLLLTGCNLDSSARLWEVAPGVARGAPLAPAGDSVAFSPDGRFVLTTGEGDAARLWDAATGTASGPLLPFRTVPYPGPGPLFSPDGRRLLVPEGTRLRLWDVAAGQQVGATLQHEEQVLTFAFRPDGRVVATAGRDRAARLWDAETGAPLGRTLPHQALIFRVVFSPDGRTMLTASADGTARLWDAATGEPRGPPLAHEGGVWTAAFHPSGKTVVTGGSGPAARLWDTATGEARATLPHPGGVITVAFNADGSRILTRGNPDARLWDATTGKPLGPPLPHEGRVLAAVFSPDGRTALTGGEDRTARLWDAAMGKPLGRPLAHRGRVLAVAFSPDGRTVATAGEDGSARLWEAETGKPLGPPLRHTGPIRAVAFSANGRTVATGSDDGTARLWDVAAPAAETVERVGLRAQALTGLWRDDGDALLRLDDAAWLERRRRSREGQ